MDYDDEYLRAHPDCYTFGQPNNRESGAVLDAFLDIDERDVLHGGWRIFDWWSHFRQRFSEPVNDIQLSNLLRWRWRTSVLKHCAGHCDRSVNHDVYREWAVRYRPRKSCNARQCSHHLVVYEYGFLHAHEERRVSY
jgi:hypothetical protein